MKSGSRLRRIVSLPGIVTPRDVADVAIGVARLEIEREMIHERLAAGRELVEEALATNLPTYGLNRGVGPLRDVEVPADMMSEFQRFIILSHAAGIGPALSRSEGRAALFTRLCTMANGGSGASIVMFDAIADLLVNDVVPVIPAEGSVGAADLSQMAAIGLVLIGSGQAWFPGEERIVPGAEALRAAGLAPVDLAAKDGLSLVGSNALSVAAAAMAHRRAALLAARADEIAAMSIEATVAGLAPFGERVLAARHLKGQQLVGRRIRRALCGGDLAAGTIEGRSLQDPISIRTIPQVHGALADVLEDLDSLIAAELVSASDNPWLDVEERRFVPNGNFSVTGLAIHFDTLRIALAHVAMMSERRIALLIRTLRSETSLAQQIQHTTRGQGYVTPVILAQTASALAASIKHGANPMSLTGTPVGDGVEDHNSMAYPSIRITHSCLSDLERLLAVESLLAATIIDVAQSEGDVEFGVTVDQLAESVRSATSRADVTSADVISAMVTAIRTEREEDDLSDCFPMHSVSTEATTPHLPSSVDEQASAHQQAGPSPSSVPDHPERKDQLA